MAGSLSDFIMGRGALRKAAGEATATPKRSESAGLDIAKMAQESADRAKRSETKSATKKTPAKRATKR
jgi:hypothetical protein